MAKTAFNRNVIFALEKKVANGGVEKAS